MPQPVTWKGDDCFTHMLVVGPTRSGKTATVLKPMIYQLLLQKKKGTELGLSVVEPKGDVAQMVHEMCVEMDIPDVYIDPESPNSHRFNPMEGDIDDVAEATVVVLQGLFGKQEAFFKTVQELSARNVTKLLKELHGDQMDIIDVMNTLRDQEVLEKKVDELKRRDGVTDLVHFFESELLGSMGEKYRQFVIGLRAQLENITSNELLRRIMTGKSDIDMDQHFAEGGVLAVNTALGKLRKSGDAFGQFLIMHLQNATFRRPGSEDTRIPHFMIVDEYSRYINPDVEMFLSLAAEYRVSGVLAVQSLAQLEVESGDIGPLAMKTAIMNSCRNKIAFGGLPANDAKEFAEEFGMKRVTMTQDTYEHNVLLPSLFPKSYRETETEEYRFYFTEIMDGLPRFHYVHKLLQDGVQQPPGLAKGIFVPRDWKQRKEWLDQGKEKTPLNKRFKRAARVLTQELKPKRRRWIKEPIKPFAHESVEANFSEIPDDEETQQGQTKQQEQAWNIGNGEPVFEGGDQTEWQFTEWQFTEWSFEQEPYFGENMETEEEIVVDDKKDNPGNNTPENSKGGDNDVKQDKQQYVAKETVAEETDDFWG
ncbi:type IV secretory system conjugative DNA transfer family protein [Lentibacillus salinarum]|uniref:Type IV secretory system conjugative DNA transfer family protein n=1 Tax=Lentibacillus salinarum TaxID=446820 RepID=A0ABW3ZXN2_9BACI